jgi:RNA polymerase sigma factor (sigma-70 family)
MTLDGSTDKQLLARFLNNNDQDAFAQIVHRHGPMVFGICVRLCLTRDDAEDATQYVFITLASKAAELHARTCLAGWLHRTADHIARRWRRSADTRRRHEYQAGALRPDFTQGEAGLIEEEAIDQLQRALGALPEDYRNALILHHLQGHTVEQVAQLLATRPGTIAARLSRGRAMLRQRLIVMGVILTTTNMDQFLHDLMAHPKPAPPQILTNASFRPSIKPVVRNAAVKMAVGAGVAAPVTFTMKVKAAAAVATLLCTGAAGAGTYYYACTPKLPPPPAPVVAKPRAPAPPFPVPISSVPEPSTLSILAPVTALLLRRRSKKH